MDANWKRYEQFSLNYLLENENQIQGWGWETIPENELFNAGIIHNFNKWRLYRKNRSKNRDKTNPLRDMGIDVLSKNGENQYSFSQCKFYNKNNAVNRNELTGFFEACYMYTQHQPYLFYSSKLWKKIIKQENIEEQNL